MNLIDTNVLSKVDHARGSARVKKAFHALGDEIRLSVVVLGEIRFGIALQREARKRAELAHWYAGLLARSGDPSCRSALPSQSAGAISPPGFGASGARSTLPTA